MHYLGLLDVQELQKINHTAKREANRTQFSFFFHYRVSFPIILSITSTLSLKLSTRTSTPSPSFAQIGITGMESSCFFSSSLTFSPLFLDFSSSMAPTLSM
mmetsp:Transcript_10970/g.28786  ORF Transcript_10970/g.28786 Transcript_10970/m.28786 type:complete len:101 (+) Transcript_10970:1775-2077(+)